ncbi:MAG: hypothetical protein ACYDBY_21680 [Thermoanaerobaculia bacterium]
MPRRTLVGTQNLVPLPDHFGLVEGGPDGRRPLGVPRTAFVFVSHRKDGSTVLCPERFVPPADLWAAGLRVLLLPANGELISEVVDDIEKDATKAGIRLEAFAHFASGIGFHVVDGPGLSQVVKLLIEAGHVVSFPAGHEPVREAVD